MEFIKSDTLIDFMRYRKVVISISAFLVLASLVLIVYPGPNYGIDFKGGTEIQVAFKGAISSQALRKTIEGLGYKRPDVVRVEERANEYMIRIQEVSALSDQERKTMRQRFAKSLADTKIKSFRVSPGGDKIFFQLSKAQDTVQLQHWLTQAGAQVRALTTFGKNSDYRYEAQLMGVADQLLQQLGQKLGNRGPETPRRIEWVGPKAGKQLRNAAIQALLYAIAFVMVYVAFRFDLRFAPGGVIAMFHDAIITLGIYVLVRKPINLTTIAALLTIIGYSINDTIVVYDRIRENMGKMRGKSLYELINLSTSQMFSRTVVTSGTTLLSVLAFFIWGTSVIKDIAFALMIGILVGTYSSIYIAAPTTEWMDKRFFKRAVS